MIKCENCLKYNPNSRIFCIYCGRHTVIKPNIETIPNMYEYTLTTVKKENNK